MTFFGTQFLVSPQRQFKKNAKNSNGAESILSHSADSLKKSKIKKENRMPVFISIVSHNF